MTFVLDKSKPIKGTSVYVLEKKKCFTKFMISLALFRRKFETISLGEEL